MGTVSSIYKEEIKRLIEALAVNAVPSGFIGWFNRETAPEGWAVCDGTNGTPDLIGRYPLGATSGIGSTVRAGLPEIYGRFGTDAAYGEYTEGAFIEIDCGSTYGSGGAEGRLFEFVASKGTKDVDGSYMEPADSPYGKSNTVTPPSTKLLPCMKL